jgi:GH24 family phage-related lysozyme (muramidase)
MTKSDITPRVALEIAAHEGMVRQAYRDSVGVLTWGVGVTNASGHRVDRYIGKPQPMSRCLEVWIWLLERYADDVREAFRGIELNEAEFAAALSFHWNTGAIHRASWVPLFRAGHYIAARKKFLEWRKPPEILKRRRAEAALLFDGQWSGGGTINEYTRVTSRLTPDWSSIQKVNIEAEVAALLADAPVLSEVDGPRVPEPTHKPVGFWGRIWSWIIS